MSKPLFTETKQIGIVVRDLDEAVRRYEEDFGIGPWQVWEVTPETGRELLQYGKPIERASRIATAKIGSVWWELIQPLDSESVHAKFLAEKGEGVHHIAVATPDFAGLVARHTVEELPLRGSLMNIDVAYLPTEGTLGVMTEIFKGMPGDGSGEHEED